MLAHKRIQANWHINSLKFKDGTEYGVFFRCNAWNCMDMYVFFWQTFFFVVVFFVRAVVNVVGGTKTSSQLIIRWPGLKRQVQLCAVRPPNSSFFFPTLELMFLKAYWLKTSFVVYSFNPKKKKNLPGSIDEYLANKFKNQVYLALDLIRYTRSIPAILCALCGLIGLNALYRSLPKRTRIGRHLQMPSAHDRTETDYSVLTEWYRSLFWVGS